MEQIGTIQEGKLVIKVRILQTKQAFGRTDYLITPLEGEGQEWRSNVKLEN